MTRSILLCLLAFSLVAACGEPQRIVNDPSWVPPADVHVRGDHIVIDRHINFEHDSDVILADSDDLLDGIADTILHHPEIEALKIVGHTDSSGDHAHNQMLSERRASAVAQALRLRNVSIPLSPSGAGELEPLCREETEVCWAQNRRVEMIIVPR